MRCLTCGLKIQDKNLKVCPECSEKLVYYKIPMKENKVPEELPKKKEKNKLPEKEKKDKQKTPKKEKKTKEPKKDKPRISLRKIVLMIISFCIVSAIVCLLLVFKPSKSSIKNLYTETQTEVNEIIGKTVSNQKINNALKNIKFMEKTTDDIYLCSFPKHGVVLSKDLKQYMKIVSPVDIQISETSAQISFRIKCIKSRKSELDDYLLKNYGEEERKKIWANKQYEVKAFTSAFNSEYKLPSEELVETLILMDTDQESDILIKFTNEVYIKQLKEIVHKDHLELCDVKMLINKE